MAGFARLVGEGQLTNAAAAGQTERRLWVDCGPSFIVRKSAAVGSYSSSGDIGLQKN